MREGHARAAVGFTVKSGWASAVLLTGSPTAPLIADSRRIDLSDPEIPHSRQPYHAGFATARNTGRELTQLIAAVKQFGRRSVGGVIQSYQKVGHDIHGAGIVVGSLIDPDRIANDHIRIHALEGRLFWGVVEDAVARNRLPCSIWRDRDLYALAAETFKQSEESLHDTLTALGRDVAGPWRVEQKTAALAAWLVLADRPRVGIT